MKSDLFSCRICWDRNGFSDQWANSDSAQRHIQRIHPEELKESRANHGPRLKLNPEQTSERLQSSSRDITLTAQTEDLANGATPSACLPTPETRPSKRYRTSEPVDRVLTNPEFAPVCMVGKIFQKSWKSLVEWKVIYVRIVRRVSLSRVWGKMHSTSQIFLQEFRTSNNSII